MLNPAFGSTFSQADRLSPIRHGRAASSQNPRLSAPSLSRSDSFKSPPDRFIRTQSPPPLRLHMQENPAKTRVVSVQSLDPSTKNPTRARSFAITLDVSPTRFIQNGKLALHPGQAVGVIQPETGETRWYSIGLREDKAKRKAVTLIVRRVEFPEAGKTRKGLLSNYLADLKPGDTVSLIGPWSNKFLQPPKDRSANVVMFSVGVAVSPFLGTLQTRFDAQQGKLGKTFLYAGYKKPEDELYYADIASYAKHRGNQFRYAPAFSQGRHPRHLKDLIAAEAKRLLPVLEQPNTHVYIAGIAGMEDTIAAAIKTAARAQRKDGDAIIRSLKDSNRWKVEWGR